MKLVEIKNNLAKLYYQPANEDLVLSDFIVVDDGNKKLLAQVVSLETTSKSDTNCAILKFALDVVETQAMAYSGYTPALDAIACKADKQLIDNIFSNKENTINIGYLTSSTESEFNVDGTLLDNFLYIQSDNIENSQLLFSKIAQFNKENNKKTLIVDFDNLTDYENVKVIELCNQFKLPVSNETLNYIYENDLTGLTLEQQAIVQDIILELQEYINTLDDGYIPFETLLSVVNDIYESDKSTGVILLRNKLLKYKQSNIFATDKADIVSLLQAIEENCVVVLKTNKAELNWQKEAVKFAIQNIEGEFCFIANINEENTSKEFIDNLYKQQNISPIISTKYDFSNANELKSYAKNLILFKPQEQQKSFATYNSFILKLAEKEFVVSGEATFYTPLICKNSVNRIIKQQNILTPVTIEKQNQEPENILENSDITSAEELNLDDIQEASEIMVEDEISRDIDKMFYGNEQEIEILTEDNEFLTEDDLELLDDIQTEQDLQDELIALDTETVSYEENEELSELTPIEEDNTEELINLDSIEPETFNESSQINNTNNEIIEIADTTDTENIDNDELPGFNEIETFEEPQEVEQVEPTQTVIKQEEPTIPIYSVDTDDTTEESHNISEGNIVYHEKYGKGIVESIFSYGTRTLCTIQFDKAGRKLLDPNIAKLEQV